MSIVMNMHRIAHPLYRIAASLFSPAGPGAKLSILIFHRVLAQPDPLFPSEATLQSFDAQMALLKSLFNVLPLPEAVSRLKAGTLPARSAAITFDDGYEITTRMRCPFCKNTVCTRRFLLPRPISMAAGCSTTR